MEFIIRSIAAIIIFLIAKPSGNSTKSVINTGRTWLAWAGLIPILSIGYTSTITGMGGENKTLAFSMLIVVFWYLAIGGVAFFIGSIVAWFQLRNQMVQKIPKVFRKPWEAQENTANSKLTSTENSQFDFSDEAIYEAIANEMESGTTDKGLWIKLYAENDGDEKKTKISYIKIRAQKLIAAGKTHVNESHQESNAETLESPASVISPYQENNSTSYTKTDIIMIGLILFISLGSISIFLFYPR